MKILDGKNLSEIIKDNLKKEVDKLIENGIKPPHLIAIIVGEDRASQTYVRSKIKACEAIGYKSSTITFENTITEKQLINKVNELNEDDDVDGFIVQLPLPNHISVDKVIESINPEKDVDGFHPMNIGKMVKNIPTLLPATPKGILEIFKHYNIETSGKNCVVVGRSQIVGTPMSILLGRKNSLGNATVTMVHSRTKNIKEICKSADIIIAAIGKARFITEEMVKKGAVIIDVGINAIDDPTKKKGYRLVGDVDFENVADKCSYITPVPKGVGPMTIAALLQNTLIATKNRRKF
ncbi:MAG: bifunctional 5,10-methylenetetrahydrofolate dehydrogenase/5,10-methenyltetrahydrofolate cyclohydrolase [Bacteroidota bacterium]|nr:bifunctional 5,10-methylenetetrahydrofolate dehydrogenase/5,10-methenyltetrahydrofolate cyclohydrolase [Bacteroidota bacterium]